MPHWSARPGPYAESARTGLAERGLNALELRLSLELELGRHEAAVPELLALRDAHPLREAVSELLLTALYRCGRRAEALEAYASTCQVLADELGIEPGPSLRAVHARILGGDPSFTRPVPEGSAGDVPAPQGPAPHTRAGGSGPAQLPADLPLFTGRRAELDRLSALLPGRGDGPPGTAVIVVVDGMAGTGKTALAVHWAHRIAHRFPDGSLYVNLRGYDPHGSPMPPDSVTEMFLVALGVAPQAVPEGLDAQAALYRSILADRRVLIVLDNARDAGQVRPLLPGTPGSLVLVTSRSRLGGLVAQQGAHPVTPGLLSGGESYELLSRRLGRARVDAEPEASSPRSSSPAPGCHWPWPSWRPARPTIPASGSPTSPRNSGTTTAASTRSRATTPAPTPVPCSPGRTRRCRPRRPGSSALSRSIRAPTSPRPRPWHWPARRPVGSVPC